MAEDRLRSASVSQIDKMKESVDVGEKTGAYSLQPFQKRGIHRSPPYKKIMQEVEKKKTEESDKGIDEREGKRRREPESMDEKLDRFLETLLERLDRVDSNMEEWKQKYEKLQATIDEEQRQRVEERRERDKERQRDQEKMQGMQKQMEMMEEKIDELENRSRRANLVIKGVPEDKGETWDQSERKVQELLEKQLNLNGIELVRAHRVGWIQGDRPWPIVVKFGKEKKREQVMQKKRKLKNTAVYIDEDFSARLRAERRQLFEVVRKERAQGRRARVKFNKVDIEGQQFKWCKETQNLILVEGWRQKNEERRGN